MLDYMVPQSNIDRFLDNAANRGGAMTGLTVMLAAPSSAASWRVKPISAALAVA